MVKRSIDQKLRLRNFDAKHGRIETGAVVKSRKGLNGVEGRKRYLSPVERKRPQRGKQSRGNPMQKVMGPIRRIRLTQSTLRQARIREKKGPSLGKTQVKNLHQRSPYAMKFEDRSHEETERQQRCARSKACNLAKKHIQAQRKRQGLPSNFQRKNGNSRLRQQKNQRKESL